MLRKKDVLACSIIKKRIYWPSLFPGKDMEDHFCEMEVGQIDIIQGTVDDVIYNVWGVKEPNYVMRMMATSGRLVTDDTCKQTVRRWKENGEYEVKKFNYKLLFHWNFRYHDSVDDHNNLRHALP